MCRRELDRSRESIFSISGGSFGPCARIGCRSARQRPETEPRAVSGRFRRLSGDDGVALVEAAIHTPVFLLLVFGILEFGLLFNSYLTAANGTRDGGRMAAVMADKPDSDFEILRSVEAAVGALPRGTLSRIVIFRADDPHDAVPSSCADGLPSSGSNPCNVYDPSDFDLDSDAFGCKPSSPDRYWCPTDRNAALSDPPDYVGIWIQVDHEFATGLFGASRTIKDTTITRIEPQGLS